LEPKLSEENAIEPGKAAREADARGVALFQAARFREALAQFETAVSAFDEVMEVYLMTGDEDYLLRIVVPDLLTLEHFIVDHLTKIPGIKNIRSSFALKQIKYKTALPTPKIKTRR